jgi:hypothetical protein
MRLRILLLCGCMSVAMSAAAASAAVPAAQACVTGTPTVASNTWDFKGEANAIFEDVQAEVRQARDHAQKLESYTRDPDVSWRMHADLLLDLKGEINDIGSRLCRLEAIRRVVDPWQQRVIDQIVTAARLMADNAQDAIAFGDAHRLELWLPTYQAYLNNLRHEAASLTRSVDKAVEFAGVSKEYQDLRSSLEPKGSS